MPVGTASLSISASCAFSVATRSGSCAARLVCSDGSAARLKSITGSYLRTAAFPWAFFFFDLAFFFGASTGSLLTMSFQSPTRMAAVPGDCELRMA